MGDGPGVGPRSGGRCVDLDHEPFDRPRGCRPRFVRAGHALSRGCRCDPDYVRSVIARFPADERRDMIGDDGVIRVDCAFCSSSFAIQPEELG